jgi:hypothetical protein
LLGHQQPGVLGGQPEGLTDFAPGEIDAVNHFCQLSDEPDPYACHTR